jgi:polar amino acid transport system permease protein
VQYQWDFAPVVLNAGFLLGGLVNTVKLSAASIILGLLIGFALALARMSGARLLAWPAVLVIEFFRNTPPLVHFFWFFYALPILIRVSLDPFTAALMALSIQSGAFFAEAFRGGIQSIETGQWEAGRALGMMPMTALRRVILPQAVRRMIPPLVERSFELVKTTALAATVAYGELLYRAMTIASQTFRPLEIYTAVALLYFLLLFSASLAVRGLEARLGRAYR